MDENKGPIPVFQELHHPISWAIGTLLMLIYTWKGNWLTVQKKIDVQCLKGIEVYRNQVLDISEHLPYNE